MSGNPQQNITAFWSTIAPQYEGHEGNVPARASAEFDAWVEAMRRLLPPAPADVLDIACGTGFLSLIAAGLRHRVTGIDLSEPMLAEARASADQQGARVVFRAADAVAPPLPPGSFDAITNRHFLWTLREPETAFRNWRELLRPGGRVVSIDGFWFPASSDDAAEQMEEPGLFDQHYTKATTAELPIMRLTEPAPIVEMFRRAGFADVTVTDLADVHAVAEDPPGDDPWYVITAART